MQAKLFSDRVLTDTEGHNHLDLIDSQINEYQAKHAIKIVSSHFASAIDPTNDGQLTHSALIFYEGSGSE